MQCKWCSLSFLTSYRIVYRWDEIHWVILVLL